LHLQTVEELVVVLEAEAKIRIETKNFIAKKQNFVQLAGNMSVRNVFNVIK
jgi:hypothetical protein